MRLLLNNCFVADDPENTMERELTVEQWLASKVTRNARFGEAVVTQTEYTV